MHKYYLISSVVLCANVLEFLVTCCIQIFYLLVHIFHLPGNFAETFLIDAKFQIVVIETRTDKWYPSLALWLNSEVKWLKSLFWLWLRYKHYIKQEIDWFYSGNVLCIVLTSVHNVYIIIIFYDDLKVLK